MNNYKKLFLRSIREGTTQLWRNKFLSGTTILLGCLILIFVNFIFSIKYYTEDTLQKLESRADFAVELRDDYQVFNLDAMKNELLNYTVSTEIKNSEVIDGIQLPPRILIKFHNIRETKYIFEILKNPRYDDVIGEWDFENERAFTQVIYKLLSVKNGIENASIWITSLFIGGGAFLLFNFFKLALFSRKQEIFIARLVGAEPLFISSPFIWEGILIGIISAFISIITFTFILREISFLPSGDIFLYLWDNVFSIEILLSGFVGGFGAWIATRQYLFGKFSRQ